MKVGIIPAKSNTQIIKNRIKLYTRWQNGWTGSGSGIIKYLNKLSEAAVREFVLVTELMSGTNKYV
jgi:hypothetical protein